MAEIKTKASTASVTDFINSITPETKRNDSLAIIQMMKKATGKEPKMWGASIIGFGELRIKPPIQVVRSIGF